MPAFFAFEVHTPYRPFFSAQIEAFSLTISDGDIGVYAHHAPFTAPVSSGALRIKDKDGAWKLAFITEGILEVKEKKTILLVDAAEWPSEIDAERAEKARAEAEELLKAESFKFEAAGAQAKLKRAENRLKVYALGKEGKQ